MGLLQFTSILPRNCTRHHPHPSLHQHQTPTLPQPPTSPGASPAPGPEPPVSIHAPALGSFDLQSISQNSFTRSPLTLKATGPARRAGLSRVQGGALQASCFSRSTPLPESPCSHPPGSFWNPVLPSFLGGFRLQGWLMGSWALGRGFSAAWLLEVRAGPGGNSQMLSKVTSFTQQKAHLSLLFCSLREFQGF